MKPHDRKHSGVVAAERKAVLVWQHFGMNNSNTRIYVFYLDEFDGDPLEWNLVTVQLVGPITNSRSNETTFDMESIVAAVGDDALHKVIAERAVYQRNSCRVNLLLQWARGC